LQSRTFDDRLIIAFPLLLATVWLAGCGPEATISLAGCGPEESAPVLAAHVVLTSPVKAIELHDQIRASGELLAVERAGISAEVSGHISKLVRDEGEHVASGEVVMMIDPERRELEVASAKAALAEARSSQREYEREYERLKKLFAQGATSSSELESAATAQETSNSRVAVSEAKLGMARRSLADSHVAAPFAGVVALRHVNRGEFVSPGTPLFELVANDPLELVFHLSEVDSGRVAIGNPVEVTVASYPDERFNAKVTFISPMIDSRSRTLRVKSQIGNEDGRLRPGLFAQVDLGISVRQGVLMIPEEAVLQRASGPIVFVLDEDDRVSKRSIATGAHRAGEVEVTMGLTADEKVVSQGHLRLVDGMRVNPRRDENASQSPPSSPNGEIDK